MKNMHQHQQHVDQRDQVDLGLLGAARPEVHVWPAAMAPRRSIASSASASRIASFSICDDDAVDAAAQIAVGDQRGNRDAEARGRGHQRLGDAAGEHARVAHAAGVDGVEGA